MMTRQLIAPALLTLFLAACSGEAKSTEAGASQAPASALEVQKGKILFGECAVCHQTDPGKGHRIGPNLHGIYGAPAARHTDFRYSKALSSSGIVWDDETLDAYLENPGKYVRGGRMAYRGQQDPEKRKALIEYLKSLSDKTDTGSTDE